MKKIISYILYILFIFSCTTTNNNNKTENSVINKKKQPGNFELEIETTPENLITEETIKDYDLTVLKGGSYPTIKNNTPFTEDELRILRYSNGLEISASNEIAHYFKYFLRDKHELLELWIENARPYIPTIREQFISADLPLELIYLPFLESGYNVRAYSRAGAGGIWQFMPKTAASYGLRINWWIDERRSPELATPYAIKHLKYLNNLFNDWYIALASYNAGEGRIGRAMKKVDVYDYFELIKTEALPLETRKYVPQYMAVVKIMKNLETLGFTPINWGENSNTTHIKIPGGTDLVELTKHINMTWNNFSNLNPSFRRKVSDPSYQSIAIIPKEKLSATKTYLKNISPITKSGYNYYTVKSGDSWWFLSKLTSTSIISLKRLNNINSNNLHIGQKLLLPGFDALLTERQNSSSDVQELQTYTIRSGDTISSISIRYNIKLNSLYRENKLNSYSILRIGQVVKLPGYPLKGQIVLKSSNYYTVKNGDSIWLIAQKTKIPYKKLLSINNLDSNSRLNIGDKILLY